MQIAIVAPCAVPYMVGGAEKLWWGLATYLNEHTTHQAEIIKLPTPERDLLSLVRSYESFAALDLRPFDAVISGKYPAWMVEHPRHICYMLHRLRGLYDWYPHGTEVPAALASHPATAALRSFMARSRGARSALAEFFERWKELVAGDHPPGLLQFPGPLAREIVHWLDDIALAPSAIVRYAAISATVARRPAYFPPGVEVAVAYPPPHRRAAPGGGFGYFYTVSRLDGPKRVGLIVEAMRKVRTDLPLLVGGTGPEEVRVRELAGGDPRIRFTGFESDAQVAERYRNALAVPFVPAQEDYGLIAVEAMQCARPVITTRDSGGVCELVEDGVSGFVCDADASSLAAAMQKVADDPALAESLGRNALQVAARITWQAVAGALLEGLPDFAPRPAAARRKLLVAATFPIFPPRHGGQARVFHLYRALAPEFETTIVSVCPAADPAFEGEIAPGVREVRIPMSPQHEMRNRELQAEVGEPITDIAMPQLHALTPGIRAALEREAADADVAVACHPYLYPLLEGLGVPIWYEAQDLEWHLKKELLAGRPRGDELVEAVLALERATVGAAELILCASPDDVEELVRLFDADRARIVEVPNGTDASRITFTRRAQRGALKARMGFAETPLALFVGSGHWPNIEAVRHVFEFAAAMPDVAFAVVGGVCGAFHPGEKPANVLFLHEVDDIARSVCLQASDVAVNPMRSGSGTNLKMLDYFAAGLPVITTERGSRGLRLEGENVCLLRAIEDFPAAIREVIGTGAEAADRRALAARELIERDFDWAAIARRIMPRLLNAAGPAPG